MENYFQLEITKFEEGLKSLDIELSEHQKQQFIHYYEILVEWNKVMNLTAITDFAEVLQKHFIDSLTIVKAINPKNTTIIDVGTGAGFPGIPIKIVFPETKIVLLDSLNKRIKFLNEVIEKLGLKEISTIHGRAEDYGKNPEYREKFDLCVSRAVANLSSLSEYCIPFVKKGGCFVSYKSEKASDEMKSAQNAIKLLGAKIENVTEFNLPDSTMDRTLISIKKMAATPKKYPRTAGKPSKEPL
ncbi:MAG: 16S rRNA (guanine(527)-N(7))-methyltransferase RsmG [Lachnospiraceae bacterium]|nr:16S rRNA (guanine(527)-N(7))-methyltransferase RsmG [Lachnospiraceae bacterium]